MERLRSTLGRIAVLTLGGLVTLGPSPGAAQTSSIEMSASRRQLAVGETFELTIRAEVRGQDVGPLEPPDVSAFRVRSRRVSRPMRFSFGFGQGQQVVQSTTVYRFLLEARSEGRYELEPARVRAGGRTLESEPLVIEVTEGGEPSQDGSSDDATGLDAPPGNQTNVAVDGARYDSEAFLRTTVDEKEPSVGEQATVTVYLYVRGGLRSSPTIEQEPSADGFWIHDLLPPSRNLEATRQAVRGRVFHVYELRRFAAFPLRAGELTIGPMEVQLRSGSLFDVFGRGGGGRLTRTGVPVTIHARALPDESRQDVPVGHYSIDTELDRSQVPTGDAVTLTATIQGRGNVRDVELELPEVDGLRALAPEIDDRIDADDGTVGGERIIEWLLVPEQPGSYELPPLGFTYFDPDSGAYARAEAEPRTLTAAGRAIDPGPESARHSAGEEDTRKPSIEASFGPIRTESELRAPAQPVPSQPWFPVALALPPLAWLGVGTSRVVRARARARGLRNAPERAVREARKRLAQAERHAEAGDPRSFYAEVARSLREVLEARTGEPMGSLTYDQLRQRLDELGMSEDLARLVIDELEGGDYARFSASGVTQEEMRHCLDRCRALIARLDRFSPAEQAS